MLKVKESDIQVVCINWFKVQYPNHMIFHIPNGGKRSMREAVKFKKMGVLAGVPDLFIPEIYGCKHGLFIELKSEKGKVSKNQTDVIVKLQSRGYRVEVCNGFHEFVTACRRYFDGSFQ